MRIEPDDLSRPQVHALLNEHLRNMYAITPPQSVHALDLDQLRGPDITFWSIWDDTQLLGCAALKELDPLHGEVKSMRTPESLRRRGAGRALLNHLISVGRSRGYQRLSLETGATAPFDPALNLYRSAGFTACAPFADYTHDPHRVYLTLTLK